MGRLMANEHRSSQAIWARGNQVKKKEEDETRGRNWRRKSKQAVEEREIYKKMLKEGVEEREICKKVLRTATTAANRKITAPQGTSSIYRLNLLTM